MKKAPEPVVHQTAECEYCGHHYIKPCKDKKESGKCQNVKRKKS